MMQKISFYDLFLDKLHFSIDKNIRQYTETFLAPFRGVRTIESVVVNDLYNRRFEASNDP